MAEESEHVRYAKIESPPQPAQVAAAVAASKDLVTIFGGAGGTFLLEELRRGAVGTMPWPSQPRAFVRIWELWQDGLHAEATELHEREILPLAHLSVAGLRVGHTVHKEVLRRQGVIATLGGARTIRSTGRDDPARAGRGVRAGLAFAAGAWR